MLVMPDEWNEEYVHQPYNHNDYVIILISAAQGVQFFSCLGLAWGATIQNNA